MQQKYNFIIQHNIIYHPNINLILHSILVVSKSASLYNISKIWYSHIKCLSVKIINYEFKINIENTKTKSLTSAIRIDNFLKEFSTW